MSEKETTEDKCLNSTTLRGSSSKFEFKVNFPDCGELRFTDVIRSRGFSNFPDKNLTWSIEISKIESEMDEYNVLVKAEYYLFSLVSYPRSSDIVTAVDIFADISGFSIKEKIKEKNLPLSECKIQLIETARSSFLSAKDVVIHCKIKYYFLQNDFFEKPEWARPRSDGLDLLTRIYEDRETYDMTITTGDVELQAHKAILAAQSAYFKAIFIHDTIEAFTNRIEANDFDPVVVGQMLEFMYTGKVPFGSCLPIKDQELELCVASELLRAADKYHVEALKTACESFLYNYINLDSVIEVFQLADLYSCADLESAAVGFMRKNLKELVPTDKWISCFESKPELELKFFRVMAKTAVNS